MEEGEEGKAQVDFNLLFIILVFLHCSIIFLLDRNIIMTYSMSHNR